MRAIPLPTPLLAAVLLAGCAPTKGTLVVSVVDRLGAPIHAAHVSIEGAPPCNTAPCIRDLPQGPARLEVTAPGATHPETAKTYVIPEKNKRLEIVFQELPPLPPLPPLHAGTAVITLGTPGATVELFRSLPSAEHRDITAALGDGSRALRMPIAQGELWTLVAGSEGHKALAKDISFEHDGDEAPIAIALEPLSKAPGGGGTPYVVPLGERITRPTRVAGMDPPYTQKAREARQQGLVIARCVMTTHGFLVGCRIVRSSAPLQNDAVLAALATHRYSPAMFEGRPQTVFYTLPFNFRLP